MMKFVIKNNVIWSLEFNDENFIKPFGIETSDTSSFFSLESNVGYRYNEIEEKCNYNNLYYEYEKTIEMHDGKWKLHGVEEIDGNRLVRTAKVICLEDSYFIDFVMRFRVKKDYFNFAYISDRQIPHMCTNVYYQYPVDYVHLDGKYKVDIKVIDCKVPVKMAPYMYVRDHEDEWVIHARMLPQDSERKVIKLCNSFCKTRPIPQWMTNILCSNEKVYDYLKYHNERTPYTNKIMRRISPNAFPLVLVKKGEELSWTIEMTITG